MDEIPEWHGWSVNGSSLHVGELPGRKQVVLYTMTNNGTTIHPLAYFKTVDDARVCLDIMDKIALANRIADHGVVREDAWLGYMDDHLVAIELEGFHAGEAIVSWENRGMRVEVVSKDEALRRWRAAFTNG